LLIQASKPLPGLRTEKGCEFNSGAKKEKKDSFQALISLRKVSTYIAVCTVKKRRRRRKHSLRNS
jgi:hypothetical protein